MRSLLKSLCSIAAIGLFISAESFAADIRVVQANQEKMCLKITKDRYARDQEWITFIKSRLDRDKKEMDALRADLEASAKVADPLEMARKSTHYKALLDRLFRDEDDFRGLMKGLADEANKEADQTLNGIIPHRCRMN